MVNRPLAAVHVVMYKGTPVLMYRYVLSNVWFSLELS